MLALFQDRSSSMPLGYSISDSAKHPQGSFTGKSAEDDDAYFSFADIHFGVLGFAFMYTVCGFIYFV